VIITRDGEPIARLTRLAPKRRRIKFGVLKGKVSIGGDFDEPLSDNVLAGFGGC
jgi:antitoxin (DNA-binding transcriptional repressor) of toxin-antitoxin stability system